MDFRMDAELYNRIMNEAKAAGISHGEYIRRQLKKGKVVVKQETIAEVPLLKSLISEFGKIGSNLNQIAHYFNGGGNRSREIYENIERAITELYQMKFEVEKLGGEVYGHTQTHSG